MKKENADIAYEIGMRISDLRRSNKMTQEVLAEKLDVTIKHVSHVERGCASFSINNLIELCDIFDCSLDYLIRGKFQDDALEQIPMVLIEILHSNDEKEKARLSQYLKIYAELYEKSK